MLFKFYKNILNELYFVNNSEKRKGVLSLDIIFNKNSVLQTYDYKGIFLYNSILIDGKLLDKIKKYLLITFCKHVNTKFLYLKKNYAFL